MDMTWTCLSLCLQVQMCSYQRYMQCVQPSTKTDEPQRINREMFVPWMQSVVNSADDLLPQEYFSAQANLVRDIFISAGFIHFWLPVQQSGYTQATNSAPWSQLHLGQSFKAKQVTPGSPYLALVSARGAAERLRCEHVPGYAQQQDASRQARDRLEQQLLDAGHLCFCQSALRQMDREAAVARSAICAWLWVDLLMCAIAMSLLLQGTFVGVCASSGRLAVLQGRTFLG